MMVTIKNSLPTTKNMKNFSLGVPLIILILLFCLVWPISAQELPSFSPSPEQPTHTDNITLSFTDTFPVPCYTHQMTVTRDGSTLTVDIISTYTGEDCQQVISDLTASKSIGTLPAGNYTVDLLWTKIYDTHSSQSSGTFALAVSTAQISIPVSISVLSSPTYPTMALTFTTQTDKVYQVYASTSLTGSWNPIGDSIQGDGSEQTFTDQPDIQSQPQKYYQVFEEISSDP